MPRIRVDSLPIDTLSIFLQWPGYDCTWIVNFPAGLSRYQKIKAVVSWSEFGTERSKDILEINGQQYHGTYGNQCYGNYDMSYQRYCGQYYARKYQTNYVSSSVTGNAGESMR